MGAENFPQRYYRCASGTTAAGSSAVPRQEKFQPQRYHPWRYRYQQAAVQPPGKRYYRWTSINNIEEHPAVLPEWYRRGTVRKQRAKRVQRYLWRYHQRYYRCLKATVGAAVPPPEGSTVVPQQYRSRRSGTTAAPAVLPPEHVLLFLHRFQSTLSLCAPNFFLTNCIELSEYIATLLVLLIVVNTYTQNKG